MQDTKNTKLLHSPGNQRHIAALLITSSPVMTPPDTTRLAYYVRRFVTLKQGGTKYGKAPHKPILLLTIIELIEKGILADNRVGVTPELVATFKENFALLAEAGHNDDFTQPFFYLKNEGFWFIQPKPDYQIDVYIRSVNTLSERLDYAYFADDLYRLLTHPSAVLSDHEGHSERTGYPRLLLKNTLLDTYFPHPQSRVSAHQKRRTQLPQRPGDVPAQRTVGKVPARPDCRRRGNALRAWGTVQTAGTAGL